MSVSTVPASVPELKYWHHMFVWDELRLRISAEQPRRHNS